MITKDKVEVFAKYRGNVDMLQLARSQQEQSLFPTGEDWSEISNLIQDVFLMNSGKLSPAYAERVRDMLKHNTESEEVAELIKELSVSLNR